MRLRFAAVLLGVAVIATPVCYAASTDWNVHFVTEYVAGGLVAGITPHAVDGYDGQPTFDITTIQYGVPMLLYRQNGAAWSGPTGFYGGDYMPPIPSGTSKTWSDIRLWTPNSIIDIGGRAWIGMYSLNPPPQGYWGQLVLDYVPASLNWTGPTEYWFSLHPGPSGFYPDIGLFPVPITSNPYDPMQVTRMHLTVYAPEPSCLAAILAGVMGIGAATRGRRRR